MAHGAAVPLHVVWGGRRGEGGDQDQDDVDNNDDVPGQDYVDSDDVPGQDNVDNDDVPGQREDHGDGLVRSLDEDVVDEGCR